SQGVKASQWSNKNKLLHELLHHNDGHGKGYYQSGWLIVGEIEDFVQAKKDGLTLHIQRERHLTEEDRSAKIGDIVAVKMPPQKAEHDFYVAVGTAGSIDHLDLETDAQIVDIYFNLSSADGALLLMESLTKELNTEEIPFHFKVLYRPEQYNYCDTARISFVKKEYNRVQSIIDNIYQTHQAHFQSETLLFTKYLAPGLSVGERPNLKTDLIQHRCQLIAEGLITAWQNDLISPADRYKCISDRFQEENISLEQPYLNPHSTDLYTTKLMCI
ncbi:MAG: T3SS effector HopA1 family protein, partial [Waterburya sp.]